MGWEKRGSHEYYYRKERDGTRVKSTYVGRGEIAHMVSQIQSSSTVLERLLPLTRSSPMDATEKSETAIKQATRLIDLVTQAALIAAGFHSHKRQWRKKRNGRRKAVEQA